MPEMTNGNGRLSFSGLTVQPLSVSTLLIVVTTIAMLTVSKYVRVYQPYTGPAHWAMEAAILTQSNALCMLGHLLQISALWVNFLKAPTFIPFINGL